MSNLYSMMFDYNEHADVLLACIGLKGEDVPRFRNCYLDENDNIVIYTRTGGGNRMRYESFEEYKLNYPEFVENDSEEKDGPWNKDLQNNKYYRFDEDDDFDSTYARFYFSYPEEYKDDLIAIRDNKEDHVPSNAWKTLIRQIRHLYLDVPLLKDLLEKVQKGETHDSFFTVEHVKAAIEILIDIKEKQSKK